MDEIYTTKNPIIRWLGRRLLIKVKSLLDHINSSKLMGLDVGCGEGHMISYLHSQKALEHLVAIDMDEERILYAKTHYPLCEYLQVDANHLAFKEGTFDYIIATEILEHLPNPRKVMEEIKRVSNKDACIIISVPHEPFFHLGNILRGKHWKTMGKTPSHVNFWNRSQFKMFLLDFIELEREYWISTFPWLLYFGKFKK